MKAKARRQGPLKVSPDIRGTRRGPRLPLIFAPSRLSRALFVSLTTTMSTQKNTPPKSFRDVPVKQRSIWESWAGTTHTLAFRSETEQGSPSRSPACQNASQNLAGCYRVCSCRDVHLESARADFAASERRPGSGNGCWCGEDLTIYSSCTSHKYHRTYKTLSPSPPA